MFSGSGGDIEMIGVVPMRSMPEKVCGGLAEKLGTTVLHASPEMMAALGRGGEERGR